MNNDDESDRSYIQSAYALRETMWCCLSCGMPFTYPEDALDIGEKDSRDLIRVSRVLRVGMSDPDFPYTQWSPVRAPLFDQNTLGKLKKTKSTRSWDDQFQINALDFCKTEARKFDSKISDKSALEAMDKHVLLCEGCSLVAESATSFEDENLDYTKFAYVWDDSLMPKWWMKRKVALCAVSAMHISSLVSQRTSGLDPKTEWRNWRRECLTRLHIGFLIHTIHSLPSKMPPFEQWYMYTFHPLVEWERMHGEKVLGKADFTFMGEPTEGLAYSAHVAPVKDRHDWKVLADVISRVHYVCEKYDFLISTTTSRRGGGKWEEYFNQAMTTQMENLLMNQDIPWAPLSASYGFSGDLMLDRLRISTQGKFRSDTTTAKKFREYLDRCSGKHSVDF